MRVVFGSRNPGKLRELRSLLPEWEIEPLDVSGIGEETGRTFAENAAAKARFGHGAAPAGAWALGEDSGLEVRGLGGRPGLRSARFAGPDASDEDNVQKLLSELDDLAGEERRARYVCALALVAPDGEEVAADGVLEGTIARQPRGAGGFGYDPVFVPEGEERTVAELGDAWKALWSHRARAARALAEAVRRGRRDSRVVACRAMDAAQALADLIEISTQIETAVLVDTQGKVVASSAEGDGRAEEVARAARDLLAAAEESMSGAEGGERLVQLQASTPEGCVFVVRDDERMVAAVTVSDPTVGLVFYDLKTCLRHAAGEQLAPEPEPRAKKPAEEDDGEA